MIRCLQEASSRLMAVFRTLTLDQDFDEELAAHLDLLTERNLRRGLTRDEARRQAILQIGGLSAARDLHRETRGMPRLERVLRYSQQTLATPHAPHAFGLTTHGCSRSGTGFLMPSDGSARPART